ncbi:tetratricopeptide repeat protein [Solimicrobium silvestre]|uniref:TPR repeat n=1 Tax=Solimicrobium silvestre TaxID=2099400 RepID=A0A2S9H3S2_9BURK|nr:hypothetical protein [Solimicrobium silvestre]PRC94617.1 TPR repeat [Solimicrobium silvestre]
MPIFKYLTTLLVLFLSACSSINPPPGVTPIPIEQLAWQDAFFAYDPSLVTIHRQDLFYLNPALTAQINAVLARRMAMPARLNQLLTIVFGSTHTIFPYRAGHSTIASETWKNKYGDCISLTMLSYAVGKALQLPIEMQEVESATLFDRREQIDFINEHVNIIVNNSQQIELKEKTLGARDFVIDFEPEFAVFERGRSLTEDGIAARFYNNLASEYFANDQPRLAYAYFKAAIYIDPSYAESYSNLAQLYRSKDLLADAEKMLRYCLQINPNAEIAMTSLRDLLTQQNRTDEAQHYTDLLKQWQYKNPYHWLRLGIYQINHQQFSDAVDSLEHAAEITHGFEEVHANLALAYWHNKQEKKAREQLNILTKLNPNNARISVLNKMFNTPP